MDINKFSVVIGGKATGFVTQSRVFIVVKRLFKKPLWLSEFTSLLAIYDVEELREKDIEILASLVKRGVFYPPNYEGLSAHYHSKEQARTPRKFVDLLREEGLDIIFKLIPYI